MDEISEQIGLELGWEKHKTPRGNFLFLLPGGGNIPLSCFKPSADRNDLAVFVLPEIRARGERAEQSFLSRLKAIAHGNGYGPLDILEMLMAEPMAIACAALEVLKKYPVTSRANDI